MTSESQYIDTVDQGLARIFPLSKTTVDCDTPALLPIENTSKYFGFLLSANYVNGKSALYLGGVEYFRTGKSLLYEFSLRPSLRPIRFSLNSTEIVRRDDFIVVTSGVSSQFILPLPSREPYALCEISSEEYEQLQEELSSDTRTSLKNGLDLVVSILAARAGFEKRRRIAGFNRSMLSTKEGYADREQEWCRLQPHHP